MKKIEIREMKEQDWKMIAEIYQKGMDTNIATFQTSCPEYSDWDSSHLKECRLVLTVEDAIAGWAAVTPVSSRCVYAGVGEISIYMHPDHQGKGYGSLLMNKLIEQAEAHGLWTLQSGIMQENSASIRLHEKCGFRRIGYREKIGRDRFGNWRNTVLMEKRSSKIV